jgi:hypothetical protein
VSHLHLASKEVVKKMDRVFCRLTQGLNCFFTIAGLALLTPALNAQTPIQIYGLAVKSMAGSTVE